MNRLITKKAFSVNAARNAFDCAEEVAELVCKKSQLCALWGFLDRAAEVFGEGELGILKHYAFSPRSGGEEGRAERRLAVKFARRIRGGAGERAEGRKWWGGLCFL